MYLCPTVTHPGHPGSEPFFIFTLTLLPKRAVMDIQGYTMKSNDDQNAETWFGKPAVHCLLLVCTGAILFIPFLGSAHLYDWDELNFAEASREMLLTGNFMRVTINYEPFWEKPPLFFWLQAASMRLFGVNEFAARFVNAIAGIITLLAVYAIGRRWFNGAFGLVWALTFACSFLPHVFFKSGIIDPVFNLFIFLGITFIVSVLQTDDKTHRCRLLLLAGMFIGLAVLAKGPVAVIVVFCTCGVYWITVRFRPLFSFREMFLFTLAVIGVSALFYGIETTMHGPWFVTEFLRYQIRLLRTGDAGHGRPFYFHFLVLLFGCFPASFFAARSLRSNAGCSQPQQLYIRFLTILFWVVLILFSIVKTKTVLYSSLAWFPITFLGALHCHRLMTGELQWNRFLSLSFIIFTVLVGIAVTLFPLLLKHKEIILPFIQDRFAVACLRKPVHWSGSESLIGITFLFFSGAAFILVSKRKMLYGLGSLFIASVICVQCTLIIINPKIEQYTQSDVIAFYKKHSGENEYVRALFKSYGDLFYGKKMPYDHQLSYSRTWLLTGPIDKPAFFVGRIQQAKKYDAEEYKKFGLQLIEKKYGYVYYRRNPGPANVYARR